MHSCDIVLGIQELQDMLRGHLTVKDFKTCILISRNWNRIFTPYLWKAASLPHGKRGDRWKALRQNGVHVAVLHQCVADKKTLQFLGKYLATVESLNLSFQKSAWISYSALEECFGRLTKLTTLRIIVDGSQFSPAMLWSLSQLQSLTKMTLCVFYHNWFITRHYTSKDYLAILDCCSQVEDLCVLGAFMEPELGVSHIKNSIGRQVLKAFSCPEFTPATPQQAIDRLRQMKSSSTLHLAQDSSQRVMSTSRRTQSEAVQDISSTSQLSLPSLRTPFSSSTRNTIYSLRRLEIRILMLDQFDFISMVSKSPHLNELIIDSCTLNLNPANWIVFSERCPELRILKLIDGDTMRYTPSLPDLLTFFPKLEGLHLDNQCFGLDPDFSYSTVMDPVTGNRPKLPPLTQLHLTGALRRPFRVLMHILSLIPNLEYLAVGLSLHSIGGLDQPTMTASLPSFDQPWRSMDILTHLDVSGVGFSEASFTRFFRQVQKLKKLKKLGVSIGHVREAIELTPVGPSGEYPLPETEDAFFYFPTVKTIYIGSTISKSGQVEDATTYDEMVFVIVSMPQMRRVELKHSSEAGLIDLLSYDYTGIKFY
ncbi:hypothetical protein BG003_008376 [Podila horticola]|nr:hypothetical protein BG003_008376 [Podila horticola]